ncbi:MAG: hypothetical protein KAW82_05560 [Desulfurellaceae bacterium]|jgi:predicted amidophosphoribosyltransferase|nr:hypothetical protein [Desulfurellaceae bacterium]
MKDLEFLGYGFCPICKRPVEKTFSTEFHCPSCQITWHPHVPGKETIEYKTKKWKKAS